MRLPDLPELAHCSRSGASALIVQRVGKPIIRLRHLGKFSKVGSDVPVDAPVVIDARDRILILSEQLLELRSERRLVIGASSGLQGPADPFFGGCFVIVVLSLVPSLVRRRLIKPRSLETASQPFANEFTIPRV